MKSEPHNAKDVPQARCLVVTVSDTRTTGNDLAGDAAAKALERAGHQVVGRRIVADEIGAVRSALMAGVADASIDVVVFTGGTGIAPRDVTPEAIEPLFARRLSGFGETFRNLSFAEMGAKALLARATAGVIETTLVFALPGAPGACDLAIDKLVGPLLGHAVGLLSKRPAR